MWGMSGTFGGLAPTHMTTKYIKAPHTINADSIDQTHASSRNDSVARWVDGTKYNRTFNINGVTDAGVEYAADVSVLVQTWEDVNADGQFVHTTNVRVENFFNVEGLLPRRFENVNDRIAHDAALTDEQREVEEAAEEAAQEKLNEQVTAYLHKVQYDAIAWRADDDARKAFNDGSKAIIAAIKRAAVYAHLNLR